jgi:hypothetical protein
VEVLIPLFLFFFSKQVLELEAFKDKLAKSHQLAISNIEALLLQLQKNDNNPLEAEAFLMANFSPSLLSGSFIIFFYFNANSIQHNLSTDEKLKGLVANHDFTIVANWDPEGSQKTLPHIHKSFGYTSAFVSGDLARDTKMLKARGLVLQLLLDALKHDKAPLQEHFETLKRILVELNLSQPGPLEEKPLLFDIANWRFIQSIFELSIALESMLPVAQQEGKNPQKNKIIQFFFFNSFFCYCRRFQRASRCPVQ